MAGIETDSLVEPSIIEAMLTVASRCPVGCFVEVGVYRGGTARCLEHLSLDQGRRFYAYDTFTGIPMTNREMGDVHAVGDFSDTSLEHVRALLPHTHLVQGIFPASAVRMGTVAFAHLDCDQYQSVRESLEYLWPRMAPNGVVWFDDAPVLEGASNAVKEFCLAHRVYLRSMSNRWHVVK